jgi:hypothetical protein
MDPTATLLMAFEALEDWELGTASDLLHDLAEWRKKGGFAIDVNVNSDRLAAILCSLLDYRLGIPEDEPREEA